MSAPTLPTGPFYHGTYTALDAGLILRGRGDAYAADWGDSLGHYQALHTHFPDGALLHPQSVFMCTDIDDIDCAGGGTDFVCLMEPLGPVSRHDLNWSGHIQCLLEDGAHDLHHPLVAAACASYWSGAPCPDGEQVWEYLTPAARVLACHPYEDMNAEFALHHMAGLPFPPQGATLHPFGVGDMVSLITPRFCAETKSLHTPATPVPITGFYKEASHPERTLIPCALDDPEMSVVAVQSFARIFCRPWDLVWHAAWTGLADDLRALRADYTRQVALAERSSWAETYPRAPLLFDRLPPLSDHDRVRIQSWIQDCQHAAQGIPQAA